MRDALIDGKFEHFRIDHDELAAVGRVAIEQRQDHRVDADRFARTRCAGDEQMRHAGEISEHRLAADILAKRHRQILVGLREGLGAQELAQINRLALGIGQFDADGIAPRHHGDARRDGAHRAGDVVGEADDAR